MFGAAMIEDRMGNLDSVRFEDEGFSLEGDEGNVRLWYAATGDPVLLYHFPLRPDIEADINSVEDLRAAYRKSLTASGAAMIEVDRLTLDGCDAIRTIIKVPQQPTGMTYLGSITLPFRDFSYVIKVQCEERGVTGWREAEVLGELLGKGEVSLDVAGEGGQIPGWSRDPYDASIEAPLMRNRAEDEKYDARFPEHPLSRLRRVLHHIQSTLRVAEGVKRQPGFEYADEHGGRPWWKLW